MQNAIFSCLEIGYGLNHMTALEGALKLTETTKRKTAGYEMEEFIYGSEMGYDHTIMLSSSHRMNMNIKKVGM